MKNWDLVEKFAGYHTPGLAIRTTLLGRVGIRTLENGDLQSAIPDDLQHEANRRGMVIINADYKDNSYTLQRIAPSQSIQMETTGYWTCLIKRPISKKPTTF